MSNKLLIQLSVYHVKMYLYYYELKWVKQWLSPYYFEPHERLVNIKTYCAANIILNPRLIRRKSWISSQIFEQEGRKLSWTMTSRGPNRMQTVTPCCSITAVSWICNRLCNVGSPWRHPWHLLSCFNSVVVITYASDVRTWLKTKSSFLQQV